MPIRDIQRRHAELGRIRLGDKGAKGQPQKLAKFRITSAIQRHIEDIAQLYGGEARPWKNGNRDEWEVYTQSASIPVIVVKGGISQWLETWSGGGCVHRCDGYRNVLTDTDCDPDDPAHKSAKPTTRLSVMLRDLDAIGVWRLESHGWNAAAELPGLVELAMHVGELVPANLYLAERVVIKDGRTSRFVVPGLDLEVSPARLTAIVSGQEQAAIAQPARAAIEQQSTAELDEDWLAVIAQCQYVDDVRELWSKAKEAGELTEALAAALTVRAEELKTAERPAAAPAVVEATIDEEEPPGWVTGPAPATPAASSSDPDALWDAIVREAGKRRWTTSALEGEFEGFHACLPKDATPKQLASFLHALQTGQVGEQVPA